MRTAWLAGKAIVGIFNRLETPLNIKTHNPYTVFGGSLTTAEDFVRSKDRVNGRCYGTFSMCIDNNTFTVGVVDHTHLIPDTLTLIEFHSGMPIISCGFNGVIGDMLDQNQIIRMCATINFKIPTDLLFDICSKCVRVNHL
jgi:hypothetical protein